MPRGLHNWTFRDVEAFLHARRFVLHHVRGSHHFYVGYVHNALRQVCVPKHSKVALKPKTLKSIIVQSGMTVTEWTGRN